MSDIDKPVRELARDMAERPATCIGCGSVLKNHCCRNTDCRSYVEPPTPPAGTQGEDIIDIAYHNRCREIATSIGRTLKGSTLGAGFSTAEGNHIDEWTMNTIAALTARVRELEGLNKAHVDDSLEHDAMCGELNKVLDDAGLVWEDSTTYAAAFRGLLTRATAAEAERDTLKARLGVVEGALLDIATFDAEHMSALVAIQRMKGIARVPALPPPSTTTEKQE